MGWYSGWKWTNPVEKQPINYDLSNCLAMFCSGEATKWCQVGCDILEFSTRIGSDMLWQSLALKVWPAMKYWCIRWFGQQMSKVFKLWDFLGWLTPCRKQNNEPTKINKIHHIISKQHQNINSNKHKRNKNTHTHDIKEKKTKTHFWSQLTVIC